MMRVPDATKRSRASRARAFSASADETPAGDMCDVPFHATVGCCVYSGDSVLSQFENGTSDIIRLRLKEERQRIDARQGVFAEKIGVKQSTLSEWETKAVSLRFEHFALLADSGVDVGYVLTGQRSGKLLSRDESRVLDSFRHLDPGAQAALTIIIDRLRGERLPEAGPPEPSAHDELAAETVHAPRGKYRTG